MINVFVRIVCDATAGVDLADIMKLIHLEGIRVITSQVGMELCQNEAKSDFENIDFCDYSVFILPNAPTSLWPGDLTALIIKAITKSCGKTLFINNHIGEQGYYSECIKNLLTSVKGTNARIFTSVEDMVKILPIQHSVTNNEVFVNV